MNISIDKMPETRRTILSSIKREGSSTIAEMARELKMTGEAVRQHLIQLESDGWIEKRTDRHSGVGGRPSMRYALTLDGEHLFPKNYDQLTVELLDAAAEQFGSESILKILENMTDKRVKEWEPLLQGLPLEERVAAMKNIYEDNDTHMDMEKAGNGYRLIERNCPFLSVAQKRPVLCSVTVSVLTRLLGCRVVREEKFQDGDARCVFAIRTDEPIADSTQRLYIESDQ